MLRTAVGYSGGTTAHPTYHDIGDHSESVQVELDPSKLSYRDLLQAYARVSDLDVPSFSRQYRNVVFYRNAAQERVAREVLGSRKVDIEPFRSFTLAEGYHQKYYLQNSGLAQAFAHLDLLDSTAAARANGYIGGFAALGNVQANIGRMGLNAAGQQALVKLAGTPGIHCQ